MTLHERIDRYIRECGQYKQRIDPQVLHDLYMKDAKAKAKVRADTALREAERYVADCQSHDTAVDPQVIAQLFKSLG